MIVLHSSLSVLCCCKTFYLCVCELVSAAFLNLKFTFCSIIVSSSHFSEFNTEARSYIYFFIIIFDSKLYSETHDLIIFSLQHYSQCEKFKDNIIMINE